MGKRGFRGKFVLQDRILRVWPGLNCSKMCLGLSNCSSEQSAADKTFSGPQCCSPNIPVLALSFVTRLVGVSSCNGKVVSSIPGHTPVVDSIPGPSIYGEAAN